MAKRRITKKSKPKVASRGQRTQIKRSLKRNEYVVYRDRKGRVRKPRRDLLLFAEVRSRKTGRRIGYLNKFKKGKVLPSRFAPKQITVLTARVEERFEDISEQKELSFTLYSSERIDTQISREFFQGVMDRVEYEGSVVLEMDLSTNIGEFSSTKGLYLDRKWSYELFITEVTHLILGAMNEMNIRMSPKKFAKRRRGRNITRSLRVTVGFRKSA